MNTIEILNALNIPNRKNTKITINGVIDINHLDCLWYDRNLRIGIEDEIFYIDIIVSGDIEATLLDEDNNELASVKGTEKHNNFYEAISPYVKNDKELDKLYGGRLIIQYNNWFDIVATSKRTSKEYQYEDASYRIDSALRTALEWLDEISK